MRLCEICKAQKRKTPSVVVKIDTDGSTWSYCARHDPRPEWFGVHEWHLQPGWCTSDAEVRKFRQHLRRERLKELL